MYPYNHKKGQRIQTNVDGVAVDRAFVAHIHIPEPAAAAADSIATIILGAEAQALTEGFENPDYPRALVVKANVSSVTGTVKITGLNFAGETIDESFTLNGQTAQNGSKAFKEITKIELPVRVHTPVAQVETATAAGTVTQAGNAKVTVTSALFTEPVVVAVPVEAEDGANDIAAAIRTALAANETISEHFTISGEDAVVILTAKVPAANDATLNIAIADGEGEGASQGVTTAATSANTTAGVPYDIVKIGWNDKLGLPYRLSHNTVLAAYLDNTLESNTPAVTVDADDIEDNTIDLHSSLNGDDVDIYLLV
jgi:hypothetical protein